MEALELFFTTSLWAAAIRIASPLIFATMGELICERAGVLNLGIEGIMTVGAFAGWITVYAGAPLWVGVAAAAIAGASFGLLHGILVVPFGRVLSRSSSPSTHDWSPPSRAPSRAVLDLRAYLFPGHDRPPSGRSSS